MAWWCRRWRWCEVFRAMQMQQSWLDCAWKTEVSSSFSNKPQKWQEEHQERVYLFLQFCCYNHAYMLGGIPNSLAGTSDWYEQRAILYRTDGAVAHVQAQMFHAGNGIDVSRYHKGLDDLKLPTSVDPPRRIGETSVDSFLKNERHNALNIAISATQHETLQEFHGQHLRAMQNDWEREKVAIRELLVRLDGYWMLYYVEVLYLRIKKWQKFFVSLALLAYILSLYFVYYCF